MKENWIVIMAGGVSQRLRPLTDNCPKPMLPFSDKPLLEIILNRFIEHGFNQFCLAINYKAEQIKNYFGDGSKLGAKIHYIHEKIKMGTAGSLSLCPVQTNKPLIVMNGDILTKVNFEHLLHYHLEQQVKATIAVRNYDFQVPYGVIKVKKDRLTGIEEKPVYNGLINAGIYVLNPVLLKKIPANSCYDMNELLEDVLASGEQIGVFPIWDYWIDIGRIEDFNRAKSDFAEFFK